MNKNKLSQPQEPSEGMKSSSSRNLRSVRKTASVRGNLFGVKKVSIIF